MFKNDLLKRIGFVTSTALLTTVLAVIPISGVNATPEVSASTTTSPTNTEMVGTVDGHLLTAAILANTAVTHTAYVIASGASVARSVGLISQDAASGTAQVATVRTSGVLSLYAKVSTTAAISADGGTFSDSTVTPGGVNTATTGTTSTLFTITGAAIATGTPIATLWTAPAIAGTYTITVTAKGGAIETTSFSQDFEVTAIQQPVISADTPPSRKITDVVSIFSSVYDESLTTDNSFKDYTTFGQWKPSMQTLSFVLVAAPISFAKNSRLPLRKSSR